jgi:hypothetical protein
MQSRANKLRQCNKLEIWTPQETEITFLMRWKALLCMPLSCSENGVYSAARRHVATRVMCSLLLLHSWECIYSQNAIHKQQRNLMTLFLLDNHKGGFLFDVKYPSFYLLNISPKFSFKTYFNEIHFVK